MGFLLSSTLRQCYCHVLKSFSIEVFFPAHSLIFLAGNFTFAKRHLWADILTHPIPLVFKTHLMMAQTSPARFLRQAVEVRYSWGFSR